MKKKKCLLILIVMCFSLLCLFSCSNETENVNTTTSPSTIEVSQTSEFSTDNKPRDNEILTFGKDIGGGILTTRKYRVRYYSVPYQFVLLVGEDTYDKWITLNSSETTDELNEMKIKRFVQHFNISREDFDKANLEFAKVLKGSFDIKLMMNPQDYADQEIEEVFNADIIYTFNDDIINNYYLSQDYPFGMQIEYEQAVADGTYQTRTTDWVDVEQMEAEIIAKYGEEEISNETTIHPYEITTTETTEQ